MVCIHVYLNKDFSNIFPFSPLPPMNKDASCTASRSTSSVSRHFCLFVFVIPGIWRAISLRVSFAFTYKYDVQCYFTNFLFTGILLWTECVPSKFICWVSAPHLAIFGDEPLRKQLRLNEVIKVKCCSGKIRVLVRADTKALSFVISLSPVPLCTGRLWGKVMWACSEMITNHFPRGKPSPDLTPLAPLVSNFWFENNVGKSFFSEQCEKKFLLSVMYLLLFLNFCLFCYDSLSWWTPFFCEMSIQFVFPCVLFRLFSLLIDL